MAKRNVSVAKTERNMSNETKNGFNEWALVELMGHQKIVGRVSEASLAGGAFLRIDVPAADENKAFTRFYGPGAIYSINPIDEALAMRMIREYRNEPVSRFELPQIAEKVSDDDDEDTSPPY
jgi:hypothetical protein